MNSAFSRRCSMAAIGAVGAILPGVRRAQGMFGGPILMSSASSVCSDIAVTRARYSHLTG